MRFTHVKARLEDDEVFLDMLKLSQEEYDYLKEKGVI